METLLHFGQKSIIFFVSKSSLGRLRSNSAVSFLNSFEKCSKKCKSYTMDGILLLEIHSHSDTRNLGLLKRVWKLTHIVHIVVFILVFPSSFFCNYHLEWAILTLNYQSLYKLSCQIIYHVTYLLKFVTFRFLIL